MSKRLPSGSKTLEQPDSSKEQAGSKKQSSSNKQYSQLQSISTTNDAGMDESDESKSAEGDPNDLENYEYDPETYELEEKEKDDQLPPIADICAALGESDYDVEKLARSLWNFLANYDINWARECFCAWWEYQHLYKLLEEGFDILAKEPYVLIRRRRRRHWVIAGPMHAHGDSLINQLSIVGTPPNRKSSFWDATLESESASAVSNRTVLKGQAGLMRERLPADQLTSANH